MRIRYACSFSFWARARKHNLVHQTVERVRLYMAPKLGKGAPAAVKSASTVGNKSSTSELPRPPSASPVDAPSTVLRNHTSSSDIQHHGGSHQCEATASTSVSDVGASSAPHTEVAVGDTRVAGVSAGPLPAADAGTSDVAKAAEASKPNLMGGQKMRATLELVGTCAHPLPEPRSDPARSPRQVHHQGEQTLTRNLFGR